MAKLTIDPDSDLVEKQFAVVYSPRKQRERFPENVVTVQESREAAIDAADADNKTYAALVYGPCRSSEGFRLFYLVEWL
ncbi:MAG: hypothetical protein ABW162_06440 [Candidatus Sedimenticola sp. PURPLELP]